MTTSIQAPSYPICTPLTQRWLRAFQPGKPFSVSVHASCGRMHYTLPYPSEYSIPLLEARGAKLMYTIRVRPK